MNLTQLRLFAALCAVLAATPALAQEGQEAPAPAKAEGTFVVPDATGDVMADLMNALEKGPARFQFGSFDLKLQARIQLWAGWVGDDSLLSNGDKMEEYGYRLRRARLGVAGHILPTLTYKLMLELFDKEISGGPLYQAWIDWTPTPYFGMTVGVHDFPFSYTMNRSSALLGHLDRAVGANAMAPKNTLGISLHTEPWVNHLRITVGVFNGLLRNPGLQGYQGVGINLGNRFEKLSYAGRIDLEPLAPIGPEETDIGQDPAFRMALGGGGFYTDGNTTRGAGASGYLHLKSHGFHLLGEVLWDRAWPTKTPTQLDGNVVEKVSRLWAQGSVGYVFWRDTMGLAVRVEYLDDNTRLDNEGDQVITAATLSYYALKHFLKVQVEYQNRVELHGVNLSNDSAVAGVQMFF